MAELTPKSIERLKECHPDLQRIVLELAKQMDIAVLCGFRNERDQQSAFIAGNSKLQWPRSKHNKVPSLAVDIAPKPIDWENIEKFKEMCELVERIAYDMNIKIRLGRDFSFHDWPHIELA
jgi:peptidoglycan L-alanyl-D-glutamate endopeptidase CwlK